MSEIYSENQMDERGDDSTPTPANPVWESVPDPTPAPAPAYAPGSDVNDAAVNPMREPAPAPAVATPQKPPSMWKRVLQGALAGLAGGGIPGALQGAVDPGGLQRRRDLAMQNAEATVKFKNASAANMVAEAAMKDQQLHDLPQKTQDEHNESAAKTVKTYTDLFGSPTAVLDNDGAAVKQYMEDKTRQEGGVDHTISVNTGGKFYIWDTTAAGNHQNALAAIRGAGAATGNVMMEHMDKDSWKSLPGPMKNQMMETVNDIYGTITPDKANNGMIAQLSRLRQTRQTLQAKVGSNPSLQPLLDKVNSNYALVEKNLNAAVGLQKNIITHTASERGKYLAAYKRVPVIDEDQNLRFVTQDQADAKGWAPAPQGQKVMSSYQQLNEMRVAAGQLNKIIDRLPPGGFSAVQVAQIHAAMQQHPDSTIKEVLSSVLAKKQLNASQREWVSWAAQYGERAMAMRQAGGLGSQGSDLMREAILATVPQEGDQKITMKMKARQFDNQVVLLQRGLPKVKGYNDQELTIGDFGGPESVKNYTVDESTFTPPAAKAPVASGGSAAPATHKFSVSAWMKANPKGNAAAARAAAKQKGYEVVP